MAANRLTRYALLMMNYDYEIVYRNTKEHANADVLSRFPKNVIHSDEQDECEEFFAVTMDEALLDATLVARETAKDPVLSKIAMYVLDGWPVKRDWLPTKSTDDGEIKLFWERRNQLTLEQKCLTWGNRVVIPQKLRRNVLDTYDTLHAHRHDRNEELSQKLCVVAQHR